MAVLQSRSSLTGGTQVASRDPVTFRAMCAAQHCAFMSDLAPIDSISTRPTSNASATLPTAEQLQLLQQHLRHIIDASCLLEPDRSCRCCPASALPPLSRAVDASPITHWVSPPVQDASFFGLDFLTPVRLRSVILDVGHTFQHSLTLEALHSLGDSWVPLHSAPQVTRIGPTKGGYGGSNGTHDHFIMRFTYNLERELREIWRLQVRPRPHFCGILRQFGSLLVLSDSRFDFQTGALPGVRLPVFSVQMLRFRSSAALPHPFVVYEIKYEVAS
jgi:hypothetical protein